MKVWGKECANLKNCTKREIEYRGFRPGYYKVPRTGRHVALMFSDGRPVETAHILVLEEKVKVPVWKQAMNMQMGRPQANNRTTMEQIEIVPITDEEADNYKFSVYTVIY